MFEVPKTFNSKPLVYTWAYRAMDGAVLGYLARYQSDADKKEIIPYFKRNSAGFMAGLEINSRPLFGLDKLASIPKTK